MSAITFHFSTDALVRDAKRALIGVLLFVGVVSVAHCGTGCLPAQDPTQRDRDYDEEIRQCSLRAETKADAKYCRQAVNRRYGLCDAPWPAITPCDE